MTTPLKKPEKLHWIKFNPTEWLGMFPELTDEEYGMLHRVIAKLWAVPGNRLSESDLMTDLRLTPDSHRAALLRGLIGYALKVSNDGLIFIPALHEAFADAVGRSAQAAAASSARWNKPGVSPKAAMKADLQDF
ncbi:MAG: hypothetical protein ABIR54_22350 [Burkholderiaceae bacterium]